MRSLALLFVVLLLAGCTQVDAAQQKLDDAKQEAQEAKDRLDRVRSATIVRTERVDLTVTPETAPAEDEHALLVVFNLSASRGGVPIERANITRTPLVALDTSDGVTIRCDPTECVVRLERGATVHIGWADEDARQEFPTEHRCSGTPPVCVSPILFKPLTRAGAEALVTTSARDLTD